MHVPLPLGRSATSLLALSLVACASVPAGPSLQALPGSQKTVEQFSADREHCRVLVNERLAAGGTAAASANQAVTASAAAGTVIGAATGAVFDGGSGAAAGAVVGMALGALAGSSASQGAYASLQQQYDAAYFGCMYTLGHKVPVPANDVARYRAWFESLAQGAVQPPAATVTPPTR